MERTATLHQNSGSAWYCLRSLPKQEHIAAAHLRKVDGVTIFCPRIRFKRPTRQGLVWVTEAMFPGYLFAHFNLWEKHRQVRYSYNVTGIVQFGDRYPVIEESVLTILMAQTGASEVTELNYEIAQGDPVKIAVGVFAGLEAVVTQVLPAKERVRVLLDFLGRQMEAELQRSNILPQTAHPLAAYG
jgi:transcriptional antiterminator RfaH